MVKNASFKISNHNATQLTFALTINNNTCNTKYDTYKKSSVKPTVMEDIIFP